MYGSHYATLSNGSMPTRAHNKHHRPSLPHFQSSPNPTYNTQWGGHYGFAMPQQPYHAISDYGYPQSYHQLVTPGMQIMDPVAWNQMQSPINFNRAYTPTPSYHHPENHGYFPITPPKWDTPDYAQQAARGSLSGPTRGSVGCLHDMNSYPSTPGSDSDSDSSDEVRAAAEASARVELDLWADGLKDSILNMMIKMSGNPTTEKSKTPDTESDVEIMTDV